RIRRVRDLVAQERSFGLERPLIEPIERREIEPPDILVSVRCTMQEQGKRQSTHDLRANAFERGSLLPNPIPAEEPRPCSIAERPLPNGARHFGVDPRERLDAEHNGRRYGGDFEWIFD